MAALGPWYFPRLTDFHNRTCSTKAHHSTTYCCSCLVMFIWFLDNCALHHNSSIQIRMPMQSQSKRGYLNLNAQWIQNNLQSYFNAANALNSSAARMSSSTSRFSHERGLSSDQPLFLLQNLPSGLFIITIDVSLTYTPLSSPATLLVASVSST